MRKKCLRDGHKFEGFVSLPYVFCRRWGCNASAVAGWAPPELAVTLHNAIPKKERVPPVHLNDNGPIKEKWLEGTDIPDTSCDCSVHDITSPGAAHADDCPQAD